MNMSSIKLPKWTAVFALALASVLFVNWAVAQKSTGRGRGDPLAYFKKHDANGDGRLTGDEIPARMRNRLKGIDTDADGVVTLQEFREMLGRKMSGKARGPGKHKIGKGRIMAEIMKRLELTEEQKADIKSIQQEATQALSKPLQEQLKANHQAIEEALKAKSVLAYDLADAQGKLTGQLTAIRAKSLIRIFFEVLTPDQQEKWTTIKAGLEARMKARMEGHKKRKQQMKEAGKTRQGQKREKGKTRGGKTGQQQIRERFGR